MPILWIYQSFKIKIKTKQNPNRQASLSREPVFEIVNKGSLVSDKNPFCFQELSLLDCIALDAVTLVFSFDLNFLF